MKAYKVDFANKQIEPLTVSSYDELRNHMGLSDDQAEDLTVLWQLSQTNILYVNGIARNAVHVPALVRAVAQPPSGQYRGMSITGISGDFFAESAFFIGLEIVSGIGEALQVCDIETSLIDLRRIISFSHIETVIDTPVPEEQEQEQEQKQEQEQETEDSTSP